MTAQRPAEAAPVAPTPEPAPLGTAPIGTAKPVLSRRRNAALAAWAVAFVVCATAFGLPTDPAYIVIWLWVLSIAWRIDLPWRSHLAFARDWIPVVILLAIYNLSRGLADGLQAPHVTELIRADEWMFGWATGGKVPTVWLQDHLYDPSRVQWWEVLVSFVYLSHFVVSMAVAVTLWLADRPRWAAFMRRWFALTLAGLITYFAYPAAPPWWAAKYGYLLDPVLRLSLRGGKEVGLHGAFGVVRLGQLAANPVAAIPSLHTAFALFVVLFFLSGVRKRFWPLLLAYPVAMTFTLVYSGEHYVIDVLVGWAYVLAVLVLVGLAERWWRRRTAARRRPEQVPAAGPATAVASATRSGRQDGSVG